MLHPFFRFSLVAAALLAPGVGFAQTAASSANSASEKGMMILPEACKKAAQGRDMGQMMQSSGMKQEGMSSNAMPAANGAYMDAMRDMQSPMMLGMSIADPNLAFVCSMIPHHQGAIDMAKAALKNAKDPGVRKMAERTIKEQGQEIEEMSRMAAKLAK